MEDTNARSAARHVTLAQARTYLGCSDDDIAQRRALIASAERDNSRRMSNDSLRIALLYGELGLMEQSRGMAEAAAESLGRSLLWWKAQQGVRPDETRLLGLAVAYFRLADLTYYELHDARSACGRILSGLDALGRLFLAFPDCEYMEPLTYIDAAVSGEMTRGGMLPAYMPAMELYGVLCARQKAYQPAIAMLERMRYIADLAADVRADAGQTWPEVKLTNAMEGILAAVSSPEELAGLCRLCLSLTDDAKLYRDDEARFAVTDLARRCAGKLLEVSPCNEGRELYADALALMGAQMRTVDKREAKKLIIEAQRLYRRLYKDTGDEVYYMKRKRLG